MKAFEKRRNRLFPAPGIAARRAGTETACGKFPFLTGKIPGPSVFPGYESKFSILSRYNPPSLLPFVLLDQNPGNLTNHRLKLKITHAIIGSDKSEVMEAAMKRIQPVILILIGLTEIIMGVMNIKMPIMIAVVLGIMFIASGIQTLLDTTKKK